MRIRAFALFCGALSLATAGCRPASPPSPSATPSTPPLFRDAAASAGIRFTHANGATGKFQYIESTPPGCAFFDFDNDGFLDILLIQSGPSDNPKSKIQNPKSKRPPCALYRNNGDGTFTDVTAGSGLDKDLGYAHGVAVGDIDNDGYDDLFITAYNRNVLLHNERGTGRFTDVTAKWGVDKTHSTGYATSAAFGDYDNDGKLDLYVCYYVPWTHAKNKQCRDTMQRLDYCSPELYDPDVHQLLHNEGGRFADVSEKSGVTKKTGRGLAAAFVDFDDDGKQDIFVANDLTAAFLWHNRGDGTFEDAATEAGVAYADNGQAMAGMGIAVADYDHSGRESLFVTNFSGMPNTLFRNVGGGMFENVSMTSGVALPHLNFLAFGCEFLDYDADGWPDLLLANGHVNLNVAKKEVGVTFKERKQLFHNLGDGRFAEIVGPALGDLNELRVARGLAVGDYDNDGRTDALFNNQNDVAQLFHNEDKSANHWVSFKTIGTKSNRDGLHTRFTLTVGGQKRVAAVRAGSSYLSVSDRRVYFGLGKADTIEKVEIRWPSGTVDVLKNLPADAIYIVTEGKGVTGKQPAQKKSPREKSS